MNDSWIFLTNYYREEMIRASRVLSAMAKDGVFGPK